jgi:hypothetical protein
MNTSESRADVAVVSNAASSSAKTPPSMTPSSSYSSTNLKNALDASKKVKKQQDIEMSVVGDSGGDGGLMREPTTSNNDLNSIDNSNTPTSSSNRNSAYITKSNSITGVNNVDNDKQSPHSSKHSESIKSAPTPKKKKRVKMQNESPDLSIASTGRRENQVSVTSTYLIVFRSILIFGKKIKSLERTRTISC